MGFDTAISAGWINYCNITACDLSAAVNGIEFWSAQAGFNVRDCYIELAGPAAKCGIIGHGVSAPYTGQANIESNTFVSAEGTDAVGIQINDANNRHQDNVRIVGNLFHSLQAADIRIYNGNSIRINGNRCISSAPPYSILLTGATGTGQIFVADNDCEKDISYGPEDIATGRIVLGNNAIKARKR